VDYRCGWCCARDAAIQKNPSFWLQSQLAGDAACQFGLWQTKRASKLGNLAPISQFSGIFGILVNSAVLQGVTNSADPDEFNKAKKAARQFGLFSVFCCLFFLAGEV